MPTLPLAEGLGAEGIIWMIILIFWGIAQVVQKARKASRSPHAPPPSRRPAPPLNDEVREMLEQLTGRTTSRPAPPPRPYVSEEDDDEWETAPPPVRQTPRAQPQPSASRSQPYSPSRPASKAYATIPTSEIHAPPPPITDIAPMILAEDHIAATRSGKSGLTAFGQSLKMKGTGLQGLVAMPSSGSSRRRGEPLLALRDLNHSTTLRRAILTKIILDPPRGLVPFGNENQ